MSEFEKDTAGFERQVLDLAKAMDRIKTAQADRDDVVVEMKQAAHTRLELLAKDLQPVFDGLPKDSDQFEFALTNGENARLWIDMTSFVRMGRDRRVYEFIKDTRLGRTILFSGTEKAKIGEAVTNYVAERVLERERAIEGDWISMKGHSPDEGGGTDMQNAEPMEQRSATKAGLWFLMGILGGAVLMVLWAWFANAPAF
ncbi:MAG: hypothetical protein COB78_04095 [Hyphomicrobiales bacterium]|nr:MAG: hypothetical protein COB78_04095 [Hyphomicrobiales bacterium]